MLIDAHCHLDFAAFDPDRDAVIEAARGVGVKHFIVPGTTRARWQSVLALGQCRADISVCAGLHPYFIAEHREQDINQLDSVLSEHPELVAVGECGIDGRFDDTLAAQWDYFDAQLTLAKQHGLPIVVHCVKANDTVAKRLRQRALARAGLIHAFAGSYEQAKNLWISVMCWVLAVRQPIGGQNGCNALSRHCPMTALCWKRIARTCH